MDDKSVDRILADMKKAPGSKRVNFVRFEDGTFGHVRAKRELRKDIELSVAVCKASEEIGEPKNVKKIRDALVEIRDQLHGCQQLLEESAAAASRLATACAPDITNPKSALSAMASGAADEIERLGNLQQFEGDRHTYLAKLISTLENVYEKHFGLSARRTNNIHRSPDPDGTFIRFLEAALPESNVLFRGKPYSRGAIGRALTDVRVGRKRRKAA